MKIVHFRGGGVTIHNFHTKYVVISIFLDDCRCKHCAALKLVFDYHFLVIQCP